MTTRLVAIIAACALIQSCAWVDLSEAGKKVRTTTIDEVASCSKLATITVNTAYKVGFLNRDDYKLRTELNDLARNEAAKLGGNTLVAMTKPEKGSQAFGVYVCP
jgi:Domain of unknown function (DUF4156)